MARKVDITFNSEKDQYKGYFQIASGYISQTTILFENEGVVAVVEAKGAVEFYDLKDVLLCSGKVSAVDDGREVYEDVCCSVVGKMITIQFPIYKWIDNYPHCDGERDRWDKIIIGSYKLMYDMDAKIVSCVKG